MKNLILLFVLGSGLVGCASAEKVTVPNGKWQPINQAGFVPVTSKRYVEGVDITINNNLNNGAEGGVVESDTEDTQVI